MLEDLGRILIALGLVKYADPRTPEFGKVRGGKQTLHSKQPIASDPM